MVERGLGAGKPNNTDSRLTPRQLFEIRTIARHLPRHLLRIFQVCGGLYHLSLFMPTGLDETCEAETAIRIHHLVIWSLKVLERSISIIFFKGREA